MRRAELARRASVRWEAPSAGPEAPVAHAAAWADWTSDFRGPRGAFAHSCGLPHRTARRPARRLMLRSPTSDRPAGGGAPKLLAGRRRPRPAAHAVAAACRRGRETGMGRPNEDGCDGEKDARMCTTTLSWAGGRSGKPRRILGKSGDSPVPDGEGFPGGEFASQRRECYTCGGARALPASGIPRDSAGKPGSRGCGDGRGDPLPKCDNLGEARYCSTWTVVERSPHRQRMTNI